MFKLFTKNKLELLIKTLRIGLAFLFFAHSFESRVLGESSAQPLASIFASNNKPAAVFCAQAPLLRGLRFDFNNSLKVNFILDEGNKGYGENRLKEESQKLIRYFLASLAIPEDELWVNLSPYEGNRIMPGELSQTDMGKTMLVQDYLLKQLSSLLTYPDSPLGSKFWEKVHKRAQELFGTTGISINTFNKIWIVPDEATVYESAGKVFIGNARLKVMLEDDYVAMRNQANPENKLRTKPGSGINKNSRDLERTRGRETTNSFTSHIMKEVILPAIEQEINHGEQFAPLRQMYYSFILAAWLKRYLRDYRTNTTNGVLKSYTGKKKIKGIDTVSPSIKEKIYKQYVDAYKKGAYDYIKKEYESVSGKPVRRRYFSGGIAWKANLISSPANMLTKEMAGSSPMREIGIIFSVIGRQPASRVLLVDNRKESILSLPALPKKSSSPTESLEKFNSVFNNAPDIWFSEMELHNDDGFVPNDLLNNIYDRFDKAPQYLLDIVRHESDTGARFKKALYYLTRSRSWFAYRDLRNMYRIMTDEQRKCIRIALWKLSMALGYTIIADRHIRRSTKEERLFISDEVIKETIRQWLLDKQSIYIRDMGVSNGATTAGLPQALSGLGKKVMVTGTDKHLYLLFVRDGDNEGFFTSGGEPVQLFINGSYFGGGIDYPLESAKNATEGFNRLQQMQRDGKSERVSLIDVRAEEAAAQSDGALIFAEENIFDPRQDIAKADIIRVANVLYEKDGREGYFSREEIQTALRVLWDRVKNGAFLVIEHDFADEQGFTRSWGLWHKDASTGIWRRMKLVDMPDQLSTAKEVWPDIGDIKIVSSPAASSGTPEIKPSIDTIELSTAPEETLLEIIRFAFTFEPKGIGSQQYYEFGEPQFAILRGTSAAEIIDKRGANSPKVREILFSAIKQTKAEHVRIACINAAVKRWPDSEELQDSLADLLSHDPNEYVRSAAARGLAYIADILKKLHSQKAIDAIKVGASLTETHIDSFYIAPPCRAALKSISSPTTPNLSVTSMAKNGGIDFNPVTLKLETQRLSQPQRNVNNAFSNEREGYTGEDIDPVLPAADDIAGLIFRFSFVRKIPSPESLVEMIK